MSSPSSLSDTPAQSTNAPELKLQWWVPNKEFLVCFDNGNQLIIRELPVEMKRIPVLDLETSSSKDELGSEWVEELLEMSWTEEEVQATPANFD